MSLSIEPTPSDVTKTPRARVMAAGAALLIALGSMPTMAQTVGTPGTPTGPPVHRSQLGDSAPTVTGEVELDPQALDQIVTLLSGYEYFPTSEDLTAVVADPVPYLVHIVYDPDGRWIPIHHHRAVGALAYFPTETTRAHLDYLLSSRATPELMRHHVINAYASAFGDASLPVLEPYLHSDDLQLRLTAVAAISTVQTTRAVEVLQTALLQEPNELVQERIQSALSSQPILRSQ